MTVRASNTGLSAVEQAARRVLAISRGAWQIPLAGEAAAIRPLVTDIALERIETAAVISAVVAGLPISLRIPADRLRLLVEKLEPLADWDRLSPVAKAGVLEHLLADGIEIIENQCGRKIELLKIQDSGDAKPGAQFGFEVTWKGFSIPIAADVHEDVLHALTRWASRLPRRRIPGLTTSIAIRRGYAVLTTEELKSLALGDGIPIAPSAAGTAVAVTGEHYLAQCRLKAGGAVLTEDLLTRSFGPMRHLMSNEAIDQELQEPPVPSSINEIPVKVVFDIGRIEMPLDKLEAISEGHMFPLDRVQTDVVDIIANGRIIGRGEIIAFDGFAAVRVTSLTG